MKPGGPGLRQRAYDLLAGVLIEPELRRWRALGARPRIWWRDDDARGPTPALQRLITTAQGRAIALAVIPDGDLPALADFLQTSPRITVGQHGVDHVNRMNPGQTPSEYFGLCTRAGVTALLFNAKARMCDAGLRPRFFTPPWNAIRHGHLAILRSIGFRHLSAGPNTPTCPGLHSHTSDLDLLRWKPAPRFKGAVRLMNSLAASLARRRRSFLVEHPIGLLTHHLDHDEATWTFLTWILRYADIHFEWVGEAMFADEAKGDANPSESAGPTGRLVDAVNR